MSELEKLLSYLKARLAEAGDEMIALKARTECLNTTRWEVECAIDREKGAAAKDGAT